MRKIEEKMVSAIAEKRNFFSGNTQVVVNKGKNNKYCIQVLLYGSLIYVEINGERSYSDCGWPTATTASRLRALSCGCIHEEIAKHFPEFRKFLPLHACNYLGQPLYAIENGIYYAKKGDFDYLRIPNNEDMRKTLKLAADFGDKRYFGYLLFKFKIIEKWENEAKEFISFLERVSGCTIFENPYKPENEKFVLHASDLDLPEIAEKERNGFYTEDNLKKLVAEREFKRKQVEKDEAINNYKKAVKEAENKLKVSLYLIENGLQLTNVIYYAHANKIVFNFRKYASPDERMTQEDFVDS